MQNLTKVIHVDLAKYHLGLIFAVIVLVLTILSSFGEKNHVQELNNLPDDRNELSSIKDVQLSTDGKHVLADVFVDYIYPITLNQHARFIHLEISGDGFNLSMPSPIKMTPKSHVDKLQMKFKTYRRGNIHAALYRSKSKIKEADLEITEDEEDDGMTMVECSGRFNFIRNCNFTNICIEFDKFNWFSPGSYSFQPDFIKFSDVAPFFGKKATKANIHLMKEHINQTEDYGRNNLITALPKFQPYDWKWMKDISSLAYLQKENNYENIFALRAPKEISNNEYLNKIGKFINVIDDMKCITGAHARQLRGTDETLKYFKEKMTKDIKDEMKQELILLRSIHSHYNITNIMNISKMICSNCTIKEIYVENEDPNEIMKQLFNSKFIIAPHSPVISQIFWGRSTFVELLPEAAECTKWTQHISNLAQINHYRIVVGENVRLANNTIVECQPIENINQIVTPSIEDIKKLLVN